MKKNESLPFVKKAKSLLSHAYYILIASVVIAACTTATKEVSIGNNDIGGTVTGPNGPEAGVWVIAETYDLPTRFAKIVVTDESGQYLLPELPTANYKIWVRGYGLIDSKKKDAKPGSKVDLTAVIAPSEKEAAQYYPAGYWFSLLNVPDKTKFPGTGPNGNGISPNIKVQADFIRNIKSGSCLACHQLGSKGTREFQPSLGKFKSSVEAWERRLQSGQAGGQMIGGTMALGREQMLKMMADWTDRIAQGEVPSKPSRPQGVERNVVISQWDWADPKAYLHDVVSTDRRNPTTNANGLLYGALELSADYLPVLDPMTSKISQVPLSVLDPNTKSASGEVAQRSPYWGDTAIWNSKTNVHNPMFDKEGRVWITATVRPSDNPGFCKEGSDHPSSKSFSR